MSIRIFCYCVVLKGKCEITFDHFWLDLRLYYQHQRDNLRLNFEFFSMEITSFIVINQFFPFCFIEPPAWWLISTSKRDWIAHRHNINSDLLFNRDGNGALDCGVFFPGTLLLLTFFLFLAAKLVATIANSTTYTRILFNFAILLYFNFPRIPS